MATQADPVKRRIGVIGAWGHIGTVLADFDRLPQVGRVVGMAPVLADENVEEIKAHHVCTRQARVFGDHRQMLDEMKPDVVVIGTRLDRIAPLAMETASRGIHVICEKPLALEQSSLRQLYDTITGQGVQCVAMLNNRTHPVLAAVCRLIAGGTIGRVALVNARKSYHFGSRPQWFGQRRSYGGTIPWIGIHALDFIHAVTNARFTSVAAMQSNYAHSSHPDCEDNCTLMLELADGGHASASIDFLRPAAAPTHGDDWLRVMGDKGVIEANLETRTCTLITEDQASQSVPAAEEINCFGDLLLQMPCRGAAPMPQTRRSFLLTYAALVARDAADQHRLLPIEPQPWDISP